MLNNLTIVFLSFVAISISSCGGSGGGGGGGSPAAVPQTILSGTVQAPSGQIAFLSQENIFEQFVNVLLPSANALISGISPVPDGSIVELDRINDSGAIVANLSTTTTLGGAYSYNLTKLGIPFSSDLIVRVSNPSNGVQMRAFAGIGITNINPVSEAAIRIVFEAIAANPGLTLGNFTPREQNDIMASIDLLITVKQVLAGVNLETTVAVIKNMVSADTDVMAFIASASASGQASNGPGDIGNYFPMTIGNTWNYQRTDAKSNSPPVPPFSMTYTISGTKLVNNTQTFVNTEFNFDNTGASRESYWAKDQTIYAEYGDSGSASTLLTQIAPFINAIFPLQANLTFGQINRTGLDFGTDLDGDGISETVDVVYKAKLAAFETLSVQSGTFSNIARFERVLTLTIHLSETHQNLVAGGPVTEWFAPGIGLIKSIQQITTTFQGQTTQETITDELTSFTVISPAIATITSPTIILSSPSIDSTNPQIAVDESNNIFVTWQDVLNKYIYFTSSMDGGTTFQTPIAITDSSGGSFPRITTDGNGNAYIIWYSGGKILLNYTITGKFQNATLIASTVQAPVNLPQADMVFGPNPNTLSVTWSQCTCITSSTNDVFYTTVTINPSISVTTPPVNVSQGTPISLYAYPKISLFESYPYILYYSLGPNPLSGLYLVSIASSTPATPINIGNPYPAFNSSLGIDGYGNVFVAWNTASIGSDIFFSTLKSGTSQFSSYVTNLSNNSNSYGPALAIDSSQYAYVLFFSKSFGQQSYDLFLTRTTDVGNTFAIPVNVSNTSGDSVSISPGMAIVGKTAYIVWDDNTFTAGNHQILFQKVTLR